MSLENKKEFNVGLVFTAVAVVALLILLFTIL